MTPSYGPDIQTEDSVRPEDVSTFSLELRTKVGVEGKVICCDWKATGGNFNRRIATGPRSFSELIDEVITEIRAQEKVFMAKMCEISE